MTNGEKYITATERCSAFNRFCKGKSCSNCPLGDSPSPCALIWLELESTDDLDPCPFCGGVANSIALGDVHTVVCTKCGISTQWKPLSVDVTSIWNSRQWKDNNYEQS